MTPQTPVNIPMPPSEEEPTLWFQAKELAIPTLVLVSGLFQSELTVTWDKPFPSNNYKITYCLWGSLVGTGLQVRKMSMNATNCVLRFNSALSLSVGSSTIEVTARWGDKAF